jgi:hypothetical protein
VPKFTTAYQEWAAPDMEMAAKDAKRLFGDSHKFIETGARLLFSGWQFNGGGIST